MPTLKEILDELEINIDGDDNDKQKETPKVDVSTLPKEQQEFFKAQQAEIDNLKNESSKKDLLLQGYKDAVSKLQSGTPSNNNDTKPEKILGVIDPEDPDAEKFKAIANAIEGLKSQIPVNDPEKTFQKDIGSLYQKHPDMVRYVKTMDQLMEDHPTYRNNVEQCYKIAKAISEGSDKTQNQRKIDLNRQNNLINFSSERGGSHDVGSPSISNAKNIHDAFDNAINQISNRK